MLLWLVVWRASALLLVSATINFEFFASNRHLEAAPATQMNCYIYSRLETHRFRRAYNDDWRSQNIVPKNKIIGHYSPHYISSYPDTNKFISRRLGQPLSKEHDLVKEHAKLVQDINSLKQAVFVAPFAEDTRDYDESVYHEIIETTTTPRPSTTRTGRPFKSSTFPVILVGGENTHQAVRVQPYNYPKATISLVGTTSSPLKHPYPFVLKSVPEKPLRVCMPSLPPFAATTRRPSLWERLINSILPRTRSL